MSDASARLLAADNDTRIYFQPSPDWNGTLANAITFRAWDRSSGSNGGTADTSSTSYTLLDQFNSAAYTNSNGTAAWTSAWVESDASAGDAVGGNIRISGGQVQIQANNASDSIYREANLAAASSATLSFDYNNALVAGDRIDVQVSRDGGVNWTTFGSFTNASNPGAGSKSYDISGLIGSNTRVRFQEITQSSGSYLYLDNVQIGYVVSKAGGSTAYSVTKDSASLVVNPVNDPPTATIVPPTYGAVEQVALTLQGTGLSIADIDAAGAGVQATLSVTSGVLNAAAGTTGVAVAGSGTGTVTLNGTLAQINNLLAGAGGGTLSYTAVGDDPPASATLTLTASDLGNTGSGGTLTGQDTATINITPVNDAPVITNGPDTAALAETDAGLSTTGTLTVGDVDTADTVTASVDSLVVSGTSNLSDPAKPSDATLLTMLGVSPTAILNNTQTSATLNWTFDSGSEAFDYLAAGETLVLQYTVRATDDAGSPLSDTETVTITITGSNDGPTVDASVATAFTEDAVASAQDLVQAGTVNFDDIDSSDVVSVSAALTSSAVWSGGSIAPGLAAALEGGFSASATNAAAPGSVAWNYNATGLDLDFLDDGETITLTFTVTATDSQAATATDTVTITINGTNDAPVISVGGGDSAADTLAETDAALITSGTLTVNDADLSDSVSPTVTGVVLGGTTGGLGSGDVLAMLSVGPGSIAANAGDASNLNWSFNSGAQAFDFLDDGESLTLTYTVRATDDSSAFDDQTVVITINGTNDAPVISVGGGDSAAGTLAETDAALSTSGTLTVNDADLSDSVTPTVTGVVLGGTTGGLGSGDVLAMLTVGPASIAANAGNVNNLAWTFNSGAQAFDFLDDGESLTLTYTVRATDDSAATDDQTITITINGTNDAPVITVGGGDSAAEALAETNAGLTSFGTLTVTDADLSDSVTPAVTGVVLGGTTGGLGSGDVLAMLSVGPGSIAADAGNTSNLNWSFNSGAQAFDFLDDGESLTLTYTVRATDDSSAFDDQTVVITINGTNDAPVISVGGGDSATGTLAETDAALSTSGTLTVNDADLSDSVTPTVTGVVLGGTTGGLGSGDVLAMLTVGPASIAADAGNVNNLAWTFNSGAQAFDFLDDGQSLTLTYTVRATDDSAATDDQTITITINGTNDAPVLSGTNDLATINRNPVSNPGTLVSELISGQFSDADGTAAGIAVTGAVNTNGAWEYSTNGGSSWTAFGSPSDGVARLLAADASTYVRFVPTANWSGTVSGGLSFRGWDQTGGTAGLTANTVPNGTTTPFSTATANASITVTASNTAPTLAGANNLTAINEDPATNPGTLVSALIAGQTSDVDPGAQTGIAVTAVDNSNGTWQYTVNGGGLWTDFGAPSTSMARLLTSNASTLVRFVPNLDWNGTVSNGITFRAWDRSSGVAGDTADMTVVRTVRDEFSTVSYTNDNGSASWSTGWVEDEKFGGGNNPGGGNVRVAGGQVELKPDTNVSSITRQANLSGASSATFSFDYNNTLGAGDQFVAQVSSNGGGSWTTLPGAVFDSSTNTGSGSKSVDITAYISANTAVRFAQISFGAKNLIYFDNVEISYTTVGGGSTAFSATAASSSIVVAAVNDAPVRSAGSRGRPGRCRRCDRDLARSGRPDLWAGRRQRRDGPDADLHRHSGAVSRPGQHHAGRRHDRGHRQHQLQPAAAAGHEVPGRARRQRRPGHLRLERDRHGRHGQRWRQRAERVADGDGDAGQRRAGDHRRPGHCRAAGDRCRPEHHRHADGGRRRHRRHRHSQRRQPGGQRHLEPVGPGQAQQRHAAGDARRVADHDPEQHPDQQHADLDLRLRHRGLRLPGGRRDAGPAVHRQGHRRRRHAAERHRDGDDHDHRHERRADRDRQPGGGVHRRRRCQRTEPGAGRHGELRRHRRQRRRRHQRSAELVSGLERRQHRPDPGRSPGSRLQRQRHRCRSPGHRRLELQRRRRRPGLPECRREHQPDLHRHGHRRQCGHGQRHRHDHDQRHERRPDRDRQPGGGLHRRRRRQRAEPGAGRHGELRRHRRQRRRRHQRSAERRRRSGAAAASTRPWPQPWKPASAQPPPVPRLRAASRGTTTSPASTWTS